MNAKPSTFTRTISTDWFADGWVDWAGSSDSRREVIVSIKVGTAP